ncbi:unnamed protein product, partial [Porites lobata]
YVLINIYALNKDKDIITFPNNLRTILQNENLGDEENIIIGGDFNCPLNPSPDKKAISLDFSISRNHIKGSGYWKMNCSLLYDDNYQ